MATIPIARTIDKRKGAVASGVVMLLILIYLLLTTFEMADPAPKDPIMTTDTVIPEELVLKNLKVGSTPPFPEGNYVKEGDIYLLEQVFLKDKMFRAHRFNR